MLSQTSAFVPHVTDDSCSKTVVETIPWCKLRGINTSVDKMMTPCYIFIVVVVVVVAADVAVVVVVYMMLTSTRSSGWWELVVLVVRDFSPTPRGRNRACAVARCLLL